MLYQLQFKMEAADVPKLVELRLIIFMLIR